MENVEAYLKEHTGYDWQELSPLYLKFKMQNPPFQRMCVFTPDDIRKQRARLYQPDVMHSLHNPNEFVEKYLNTKKQLVKSMPWVKFDLDEFGLLPNLKGARELPGISPAYYTYEIGLTGDAKLRPINSRNDMTLGTNMLNTISTNAKVTLAKFLTTFKASYNIDKKSFSFGESVMGTDGVTSLKLVSPNILEGEVTPSVNFNRIIYKGWEIET